MKYKYYLRDTKSPRNLENNHNTLYNHYNYINLKPRLQNNCAKKYWRTQKCIINTENIHKYLQQQNQAKLIAKNRQNLLRNKTRRNLLQNH